MLVIGLGIAIIVVLALMIGMAIKQAVFDKPAPTATASFKPGDVPELNLDLAPGTSVAEARMDGANLVVRITGPDADEVLVIDPAKSRVVSRVRFNKKAP